MAIKYFTGKPCKRGHIGARLKSSGACVECSREANRVRYLENREAIRMRVKAYVKANPEKLQKWHRDWYQANIESEKVRGRERYLADPEKYKAKLHEWNKANPERSRARTAAWGKANPERLAAKGARRRAAKFQQCPAWADHEAIAMMYRAAEVFRVSGFDCHVDHIIPLQGKSVRGLHVHNNLQIITAKANRSKSNQLHI